MAGCNSLLFRLSTPLCCEACTRSSRASNTLWTRLTRGSRKEPTNFPLLLPSRAMLGTIIYSLSPVSPLADRMEVVVPAIISTRGVCAPRIFTRSGFTQTYDARSDRGKSCPSVTRRLRVAFSRTVPVDSRNPCPATCSHRPAWRFRCGEQPAPGRTTIGHARPPATETRLGRGQSSGNGNRVAGARAGAGTEVNIGLGLAGFPATHRAPPPL